MSPHDLSRYLRDLSSSVYDSFWSICGKKARTLFHSSVRMVPFSRQPPGWICKDGLEQSRITSLMKRRTLNLSRSCHVKDHDCCTETISQSVISSVLHQIEHEDHQRCTVCLSASVSFDDWFALRAIITAAL